MRFVVSAPLALVLFACPTRQPPPPDGGSAGGTAGGSALAGGLAAGGGMELGGGTALGGGEGGGTGGGATTGGGTTGGGTSHDAGASRHEELFEQSAVARIRARAEADGGLTQEQAALLELLARFDFEALPAEFRIPGELPPHNAGLLRWVQDRRASYSAADQAVIDEMAGPPESVPGRGRIRGFGMGSAALAECFSYVRDGGQADDTPLIGQLIATRHLDVIPILPPQAPPQVMAMLQQRVVAAMTRSVTTTGDIPTARTFSEYLDLAFEHLERIGFTRPTARPRIYVSFCGGRQDAFAYGSTIVTTLEMGFEDPELRKVVLPHELTHVFQSDVASSGQGARDWPVEALATAVEQGVAPEVKRWSNARPVGTFLARWFIAMDRSLRCPEEPFHSSFQGACRASRGGTRATFRSGAHYDGDYSKFLFFLMLRTRGAGQASVYGAWWQRFKSSGGLPSSVITDQEISDYQIALLGDEFGAMATGPAFGPGIREELTSPNTGLDLPTLDPRRYTYLFDAATQELRARYVPGGGRLPRAPFQTELGAERIFPTQGAAVRILVEAANVSIGRLQSFGAMSTISFRHGGDPIVRSRLISGNPAPATQFAALDVEGTATSGWVPVPAGPQITRQYVLLVVSARQTPATVSGEYGVQLGPRCSELCQPVYRPRLPACCPAACQCPNPPPDCLSNCVARADEYALNLCASICNADDKSYTEIFADAVNRTVPGKICGTANPATTPSGLVDVQFAGLTCEEMGVDSCQ